MLQAGSASAAVLVCDVADGHAGASEMKDFLDIPFLLTLQPSASLKKMQANVLACDRDDGGMLLLPCCCTRACPSSLLC